MAYTRDPDYMTRGVGAIASADGSPARQRRHARVVQATQARDRVMANVARGSLGASASSRMTAWTWRPAPPPLKIPNPLQSPKPPMPVLVLPPVISDVSASHPLLIDPVYTPPPAAAPAPMPPVRSGGAASSSGSGSGGTGVAMGPPSATVAIPPIPILDDSSAAPLPVAAPDNTMRNVLIAGGAAVAAYLLFFRKRSP